MIKINFVTERENERWILRRWCEEWQKFLPGSTISFADAEADVNVFCNYALFYRHLSTKFNPKSICIFTHREKEDSFLQEKFDLAARFSDWCFAQSKPTLSYLPENRSSLISISVGAGFFAPGKPKIGIVGRDYSSGRKNYHWIEELKKLENVEIIFTDGKVPYEQMPEFYSKVDYVLITANNEGGPMPVAEALAMHKPVIAPVGVGWCDEYSTIKYDGTLEDLINVLTRLTIPRNGWEIGAKQIYDISERLLYGNHTGVDQSFRERRFDVGHQPEVRGINY